MNPWEAKEHRKGVVETALLRNHVRELLEMTNPPYKFPMEKFLVWREEAIDLFNRKGWFDTELRNAIPFQGEPPEPNLDNVGPDNNIDRSEAVSTE
jgi:hypothetical protein